MGALDMLEKSFDDLFEDYITDLIAQDDKIDVSTGSLERIRGAAIVGVAWGILQTAKSIRKQIHPDTADTQELEHHASDFGQDRKQGESDGELLKRLLIRLRTPPASGNENDYETWAREVPNVSDAYCYPILYGVGTVGVLILADKAVTGGEVPSSHTGVMGNTDSVAADKLPDSTATFITDGVAVGDIARNTTTGKEARVTAVESNQLSLDADIFPTEGDGYTVDSLVTQVRNHLLTLDQPVFDQESLYVFGPSIDETAVDMTMTGGNKAQAAADITAYMNALEPGETLYQAQLTAIAIANGAENADITAPGGDVVPEEVYGMIRPGVIYVT